MRFVYNILFAIFFGLSSPYYFLKMWRRGNWQRGFRQRFGRYGKTVRHAITNRHVLWLHAVSVGEVNICTQLIKALEIRVPNLKIVVSTTTSTGMGELEKKLPPRILKVYYPIDFPGSVRKALAVLHPVAVVLVEAEIWPNFLWRLQALALPHFLVNARLSERSYHGYRRFGFLFRKLFGGFAGVGCQNEADAVRLRELGCRPEAVRVVGNLKFDAAKFDGPRTLDVPAMLRQLGVKPGARIVVAGSTHAGEEGILAGIYRRLKASFPDLFLVLVPRHFERAQEAGRDVAAQGVKAVFRTTVASHTTHPEGTVDCLLVNTTGELRFFYEQADVVFVGKSLTAEGGQNPIEPGAMGKAMVFGPNMQNFAAIADALVKRGGALVANNADELERVLGDLLQSEDRRRKLGENARQVVEENLGAVDRTVAMIAEHLRQQGVYVAEP